MVASARRLPTALPRTTPTQTALATAAVTAEAMPPPERNTTGGFSIARQLGLGVSRIVIDPGHGGHDPGAKGNGVSEAELVLDVALRLEKLLQKQPGIEVVLTRRTDEFVALPERTAIANREGADLFLSIHANASANAQARGVETYFLNFANNLSAAAVAARENAASGQAMGALPDFVKAIALNNKLDESRDFATHVQRAMIERLRPTNKTVEGSRREAGAVRRADRRGDAERAGRDLVRDEHAGSEAAEAARLPPADRRSAVRRDPQVSDVAARTRRRSRMAAVIGGCSRTNVSARSCGTARSAEARIVATELQNDQPADQQRAEQERRQPMTPVSRATPMRTSAARSARRRGSMMLGDDDLATTAGDRSGCSPGDIRISARKRQLGERADRDAGRAFRQIRLRFLGPRRAGDVEVRPRQAAGELLQEQRRRDRSGRPAAGVREVGDLALDLIAVFVEQRHRPDAIAGAIGDAAHALDPRVAACRTGRS